ncbi:hypothetical protein AMK59_7416, partial [Oryctes borbonicus]
DGGSPRKTCLMQKPGHKYCTCEEIMNAGNAKVIRCTSPKTTDDENERACFCMSQIKPSLAARLHQRLNQTLDSFIDCACDVYEMDDSLPTSPDMSQNETLVECECPDVNVGEVYRNIYRKARSRFRRCDKYVTPCCT